MRERRRAVAFLSEQQIARMLALPEGLRVAGVRDDFVRNGVSVLVEGNALDPVPENVVPPDLLLAMLDSSALAMRAEVSGWDRNEGVNLMVTCPACPWTWEPDRYGITLAMAADAVQQHLIEAHAEGEKSS